jgi:hypothetical protein
MPSNNRKKQNKQPKQPQPQPTKSTLPPPASEAERFERLSLAAEEEIVRLRPEAGPGDGIWVRAGDRSGIRAQVEGDKGKGGYGPLVWLRAPAVRSAFVQSLRMLFG